MPYASRESGGVESRNRIRIHIAHHHQIIRIRSIRPRAPQNSPIFHSYLISRVIIRPEEEKLVFMWRIQVPGGVFLDGEVDGFYSGSGGVGSSVRGG